jgi:hypothetical protein
VETEGQYFLVGNTKEPCDFAAAGFEPPPEIDALKRPYIKLSAAGRAPSPRPAPPWLSLSIEGEALARLLSERFLIERNGSVSDRLWRIVVSPDGRERRQDSDNDIDARWLCEVPAQVWQIVRDTVLRCT